MTFEEARSKIEAIDGLISIHEAECLFNLASQMPMNGVGLEVGSHKGKSSISLGLPCIGSERKIYCHDLWGYEPYFEEWKKNVGSLGLSEILIPIKGWSSVTLKLWNKPLDLVFIDSSHEFANTIEEYNALFPWVKRGGVMAFHDVGHPSFPGVLEVWDKINGGLEQHGSVYSIFWGKKK